MTRSETTATAHVRVARVHRKRARRADVALRMSVRGTRPSACAPSLRAAAAVASGERCRRRRLGVMFKGSRYLRGLSGDSCAAPSNACCSRHARRRRPASSRWRDSRSPTTSRCARLHLSPTPRRRSRQCVRGDQDFEIFAPYVDPSAAIGRSSRARGLEVPRAREEVERMARAVVRIAARWSGRRGRYRALPTGAWVRVAVVAARRVCPRGLLLFA